MYIVKFSKDIKSFWLYCTVLSKEWSEEMNSHTVNIIGKKKTLFYFIAKRWSHNIIINDLLNKQKLEIVDG